MEIQIGRSIVGDGKPTYIIAEIGQNHQGDVYQATRLCAVANECGVNAVKFCKRDLSCEMTAAMGDAPYVNGNSFGETYRAHREALELNEREYRHLKERIRYNEWSLDMFASVCDLPSVDLMERVGVPAFKIASRDIDNIPLIRRVASTHLPVILSTGMSDISEIEQAVAVIQKHHTDIVIMQCTSQYPTENQDVNLRAIDELRRAFGLPVGLSDHTPGIKAAVNAINHGACMIEKHFTFSRSAKGTDHAASLEPKGLRQLVEGIRITEEQQGDGIKAMRRDATTRKLRRSLVSVRRIEAGQTVTEDCVCLKSPGTGVAYRDRKVIVGKVAVVDIPENVTIDREWVK